MQAQRGEAVLVPFSEFLDAHRDLVWRFLAASVGPVEADDCFQETWIAALRAYPRLRRDSNPRAWILTIAHRKALDAHRRRARHAVPVADVEPIAGAAPEAPAVRDDALWEAVHALPPKQRAAVLLRHNADLSHREIAEVLGSSEEAARSALHEGIAKLRKAVTA
jgi:RNA polymerase sigma factor (sigma-70 family)